MTYIDELLGRNEQILHEARQHVVLLVSRVFTKLILIGILVATAVVSREAFRASEPLVAVYSAGDIIPLLAGMISVLLLVSIFTDFLNWHAELNLITDSRVIQIRGVLSRSVVDMSLEKIHDIALSQSVFGRMFGYGTIRVLVGKDDSVNMEHIVNPMEFKRVMREAWENYRHGYGYLNDDAHDAKVSLQPAVGKTGHAQVDVHRALEDLATLRDRGILSPDEFEAKKRELLKRI